MTQGFAEHDQWAPTETVAVPFEGEGSGEGELTWAQRSIWESMRSAGRSIAIGGAMALPAGTEVADMARVLRFAMSRHQSLRTRLRFRDDGTPAQVVSASGEATLAVVDVPDDGDPAGAAEAIRARQELGTFDYAAEWPVWMTVVRHRGAAAYLVVMYSHLAVDGNGIAALVEDLATMDPRTGESSAAVRGIQPLDLARQQGTDASRRHSDAALRHWERLLRAIPAKRFPELADAGLAGAEPADAIAADPGEPPFWELECRSPAMFLAMQSVMLRTGVDSNVVLLAAYAAAMARLTGGVSVAQIVVDNRFRPGFAGSVSHLAQYCPVAIDALDCTFDDATTRAWQASVMAAKYAYYDAAACHELIAKVGGDRGEPVETACFVNDRRTRSRAASGLTPAPEDVEDALPGTTRRWGRRFDWYDGLFFLHVDEAENAIAYSVWADTRRLPPAGIEAFARHFEDVVVEAAFDPSARACPVPAPDPATGPATGPATDPAPGPDADPASDPAADPGSRATAQSAQNLSTASRSSST